MLPHCEIQRRGGGEVLDLTISAVSISKRL